MKPWYSGNQKLYGYKTEISVEPCRIAVHVSSHCRRSVIDIIIIKNNSTKHEMMFRKKNDEIDSEDSRPDNSQRETHWSTLNDSGYQGANEHFRVIHPFKNQKNRRLSTDKKVLMNEFEEKSNCRKYSWHQRTLRTVTSMR